MDIQVLQRTQHILLDLSPRQLCSSHYKGRCFRGLRRINAVYSAYYVCRGDKRSICFRIPTLRIKDRFSRINNSALDERRHTLTAFPIGAELALNRQGRQDSSGRRDFFQLVRILQLLLIHQRGPLASHRQCTRELFPLQRIPSSASMPRGFQCCLRAWVNLLWHLG